MDKFAKDNWRETDLNVDSLWIIDERAKGGKRENNYHGNFIPQIPDQLIRRYTSEGDTVLELFSGSGTTLYECETLGRNYIGFDINRNIIEHVLGKMKDCSAIRYSVCDCDVTDKALFDNAMGEACRSHGIGCVDFMIAHPPYLDIVKFSNDDRDLSRITDVNVFIDKFVCAVGNGLSYLSKDKYFAIVGGDIYKNREVVPLAFYMMDAVKKAFNVKLKGIIVKNIEGNRGKIGSLDIWRYRALQSDYFLFKHEYVFVFKKVG